MNFYEELGNARSSSAEEIRPQPAPAAHVEAPRVSSSGQASELPAAPPPPAGFGGNWFYVPDPLPARSAGRYPPEYIQLCLVEDSGELKGRYRSRYVVTDQAISPDVSFEFKGASRAPAVRLLWTAPGGASGEIVLRLLSARELQVEWRAYRLGGDIFLTAGTATLVRQQDQG